MRNYAHNGSNFLLALLGVTVTLLFWPALVHAEERSYHDTIPLQRTDWQKTLAIPRFDPALGILTKLELQLEGRVNGNVRLENLDAAPALVTAESIADIVVERPDGTFIVMATPAAAKARALAAFDNTIDFGGASGATINDIVGLDIAERVVYTTPADLQFFTGAGTINLAIHSTGRSRATGAGNLALSFSTSAGAAMTVTYTIAQPAITLEKHTNGLDADQLPGPVLYPGDLVTWTYVVTNTGDVPLVDLQVVDDREGEITDHCPQRQLALGETMTCRVPGVAHQGLYTNTAVVTGSVPSTLPGAPRQVTDTDPSHYMAIGDPAIDLEKLTNGQDADRSPGPSVAAGTVVTWEYIVRNVGELPLVDLTLVDDREGDVTASCPQRTLAVGAQMVCVVTGIAQHGQYTNTAVVTATTPPDAARPNQAVRDEDPSHYWGVGDPAIALEKLTNGEDADQLPGPLLTVGATVTWHYQIRNVGELDLANIRLTDDREGDVTASCPQSTLAVGEQMVCAVQGIVQLGQYTNTATVTGTTPPTALRPNVTVTDEDPSHYVGTTLPFCTLDGRTQAYLPDVHYLGEGPGLYDLPVGAEQLIVKKLAPFHFITQEDSPYQSTRTGVALERVWACRGDCTFTRALAEVVSFGWLPQGTTLHLLILDDDDDERVNTLFANRQRTQPWRRIDEQQMTESLDFTLPETAEWQLDVVDSIGYYICVVPN